MIATRQQAYGVGAVVLIALAVVLVWVWWPAPAPSPAEDALRQQIERLRLDNERLAAEAAAKAAEAAKLQEQADVLLERELPAIRSRRRAARADSARRTATILATPDAGAVDALRDQHERTRRALESVRAAAEPAESGGTAPDRQ